MENREKTRKTYRKPSITRVKLEMEEAVLQACKTAAGVPASANKECGHPGCKTILGS
ncbi:MAG: hypothetical protein MUO52_13010 [Desulfobacterales bacterium]|nr:hypothetical protein [Desulfobacterales bacterium]